MKANFYRIKCVTNMHMGSGDINFNIVDNEVQRDPVTGYPTMFSSGVKGALRQHFADHDKVVELFGSDIKESDSNGKSGSTPGKLKFLPGNLLFLPVRASKGDQAYYMVTTKSLLMQFESLYQTVMGEEYFGNDRLDKIVEGKTYGNPDAEVDGLETTNEKLEGPLDECLIKKMIKVVNKIYELPKETSNQDVDKIVIMKESDLRKINLPVLARNQLENGISQNLWYEEVVPHEAIFYTAVLSDGTHSGDAALAEFDEYIKNNNLVQFGGNATIGYGLTQITKMSDKEA